MSRGYLLSIPAAALAAWLIAALWYSRLLFAKAWAGSQRQTPGSAGVQAATPAGLTHGLALLAFVLMAAVLRVFISHLGVRHAHDGAGWGFHAWLGFALPLGLLVKVSAGRPWAAFWIDTGCQAVFLTVMGTILGGIH